jgi:hypothetical protein
MRRHAVLFVVSLVLVPAWSSAEAGTIPIPGATPRGSTLIVGDTQFDAEHGVEGGSGTPEDPYRIGGSQLLVAPQAYGLRLVGTRAHVVIHDVTVLGDEGFASAEGQCLGMTSDGCHLPVAILLEGAQNVTIQRLVVREISTAIETFGGAAHIRVMDSHLSALPLWPEGASTAAAWITDTSDVSFVNVSAEWSYEPFHFENVTGALVDGGFWDSIGTRPHIVGSHDVAVRHARLATGLIVAQSDQIRIEENTLTNASLVMILSSLDLGRHISTIGTRSVLVCGNEFDSPDDGAIKIEGVDKILVAGNKIHRATSAIFMRSIWNATIEHNLVEAPDAESFFGSMWITSRNVTIRNNSFDANTGGLTVETGVVQSSSIIQDWWGDASGPAPYGSGARVQGPLSPAPWLTSPPSTNVDCAGLSIPR